MTEIGTTEFLQQISQWLTLKLINFNFFRLRVLKFILH